MSGLVISTRRVACPSHRRTVPGGRRVHDPVWVTRIGTRRAAHQVPVAQVTRRRRLLTTLLATLSAIGLAAMATVAPVLRTQATAGPGAAVPVATMIVQPGDTLMAISKRAAPRRDWRDVAMEIRGLNALPDSRIYVGERLVLPIAGP